MKSLAVSAIAIGLAGCAYSEPVYTPSGVARYHVTCTTGNRRVCFQRAGEICGARGYTILDINDSGPGIANIRSMMIQCNR
jgi:hypothetical protein